MAPNVSSNVLQAVAADFVGRFQRERDRLEANLPSASTVASSKNRQQDPSGARSAQDSLPKLRPVNHETFRVR